VKEMIYPSTSNGHKYNYKVKAGEVDPSGQKIKKILAQDVDNYLVYSTAEPACYVIADHEELLTKDPEICKELMLIRDYRENDGHLKAKYYPSYALAVSAILDGNTDAGRSALRMIREDMEGLLKREAIRLYLLGAAGATAAVLLVYGVFYWYSDRFTQSFAPERDVFFAVALSALGGFLSVATGTGKIKAEALDTEIWKVVSGATRIAIAVVSGILILYAIRGNLIFSQLNVTDGPAYALFIAFAAAGFIEKLIPNLMHKVGDGEDELTFEPKTVEVVQKTKPSEEPLTRDLICVELKKRLRDDNPGAAEDWDANKWLDKPVGEFCNNDDENVRNVVCSVIGKMLLTSGLQLTGNAKHDLRNVVNSHTYCKSAVDAMVKAKNSVEPKRSAP
jgi:hypothetical protein